MGLFSRFPYTNFHELNLDWILRKLRELTNKVDKLELEGVPAGGADGQVLTKDGSEDYKTKWADPAGGSTYELPVATSTALGGVKADGKSASDTVPVRIGADGKLYCAGGGAVVGDYLPLAGGTLTGALKIVAADPLPVPLLALYNGGSMYFYNAPNPEAGADSEGEISPGSFRFWAEDQWGEMHAVGFDGRYLRIEGANEMSFTAECTTDSQTDAAVLTIGASNPINARGRVVFNLSDAPEMFGSVSITRATQLTTKEYVDNAIAAALGA